MRATEKFTLWRKLDNKRITILSLPPQKKTRGLIHCKVGNKLLVVNCANLKVYQFEYEACLAEGLGFYPMVRDHLYPKVIVTRLSTIILFLAKLCICKSLGAWASTSRI